MRIYDGRESFYQWDLNQLITSKDFSVGDEIHFSNARTPRALPIKARELDGSVVADVPNILLQTALPIIVHRYVQDETSAQTTNECTFSVKQRPQPNDYFYTETDLYSLRTDVETTLEETKQALDELQGGLWDAEDALESANTLIESNAQLNTTITAAEQNRSTDEEQRQANERVRIDNETGRVNAEKDRADAESLRKQAESDRNDAETQRVTAEQNRVTSEDTRVSNEQDRVTNETNRTSAEQERVTNELGRVDAEKARVVAETNRATAETNRQTAEATRTTSEQNRVDAETLRVDAEQKRVEAEEIRVANFETSRNNVANAVKATASGEVIRVDDVSPITHTATAKVSGKNLFHFSTAYSLTSNGMTCNASKNTAEFVLNGTAEKEMSFMFTKDVVRLPVGTYTASLFGANIVNASHDRMYVRDLKNEKVLINQIMTEAPKTFTITEETDVHICIILENGSTYENAKLSVQLEEGDTATEYEPYIDPTTVTVTACGKNLLRLPDKNNTITNTDGMNLTADVTDGQISLSGVFNGGTPKAKVIFTDLVLRAVNYSTHATIVEELSVKIPKGTYVYSANESMPSGVATGSGGVLIVGELGGSVNAGTATEYQSGDMVTVENDNCYAMFVVFIYSSAALENFRYTAKPQLEVSSIIGEWEQGKQKTTYAPLADGTCEITSISPTMTLFTDTVGVNIEVEYNQDTNTALDNVKSDIRALDDAVATLASGGAISQTKVSLTDSNTGKAYTLYVLDGKLMLAESEG